MSRLAATMLLCVSLLASCSEPEEKQVYDNTQVKTPTSLPEKVTPYVKPEPKEYSAAQLNNTSALHFVDSLKKHVAIGGFVSVNPVKNWVKKSDIKVLMTLIKDKTPCAGVMDASNKRTPPTNIRSTVGIEAMMMIEGYRVGKYPPYLTSVEFGKGMQMDPKDKKLVLLPNQDLIEKEQQWYKTQFK